VTAEVAIVDGRTVGFGIVGCGVISKWHAMAVADLPGATLVGVTDAQPERAEQAAARFGTECVPDLDSLLARDDLDVVCVCTPSGLHAEVGVQAARAGKHVIVEKPIDVSLEAADRLITACREAGVRLGVIFQHRFDDGVQALRDLIDSGRLGRLLLGAAATKWYRTQEYYDSGAWRGSWELDGGGCLMNQGVHYVDLLQWMMGPVERVVAQMGTLDHDIEVEDAAMAMLTFAGGAMGTLEGSTVTFPGLPERLEVSGTGGSVVIDDGEISLRELKDERGETGAYGAKRDVRPVHSPRPSGAADPAAIRHEGHRRQFADFLEALRTGRDPLVTGEEGRKSLEIILAVYESARTGRPVTLSRTPARV